MKHFLLALGSVISILWIGTFNSTSNINQTTDAVEFNESLKTGNSVLERLAKLEQRTPDIEHIEFEVDTPFEISSEPEKLNKEFAIQVKSGDRILVLFSCNLTTGPDSTDSNAKISLNLTCENETVVSSNQSPDGGTLVFERQDTRNHVDVKTKDHVQSMFGRRHTFPDTQIKEVVHNAKVNPDAVTLNGSRQHFFIAKKDGIAKFKIVCSASKPVPNCKIEQGAVTIMNFRRSLQ